MYSADKHETDDDYSGPLLLVLAIVASLFGLVWLEAELAASTAPGADIRIAGHPRPVAVFPTRPIAEEPQLEASAPIPRPRPSATMSSES